MKIRLGHVTNSSSASYTCEISGKTRSGWDASPRDLGMAQCENEHVMLEEFAIEITDEQREDYYNSVVIPYVKNRLREDEDANDFDKDEIYEIYFECHDAWNGLLSIECPICQFAALSEYDLKRFLLRRYNVPEAEAFAEVKARNKRRRKLYDNEYIKYVLDKHGLTEDEILDQIKAEFGAYNAYKDYCFGKD